MNKIESIHQKLASFSIKKWKQDGRRINYKKRLKTNQQEYNTFYLLSVNNFYHLSKLLQIDESELIHHINEPEYIHYEIKKKKGGVRSISAPESTLKRLQKRLNFCLQQYYFLIKPAYVHGFVLQPKDSPKFCPIVENACVHTRKKVVLNIDLKDFFPSISAKRVKELFTSEVFRFHENIAIALALLTTYEKKLPTGAPTSPVISNFICLQLDEDLNNYCIENQITYTRYADDLTFSANESIHSDQTLDIIGIILSQGFRINEKKLRIKLADCRQTVTGLVVNEKVNVPRELIKNIRAMLHDLTVNGAELAAKNHFKNNHKPLSTLQFQFLSRLKGFIDFIGQVRGKNDSIYLKFKIQYYDYIYTFNNSNS
jgi:RNA-directed DNA polymerase